MVVATRGTPTQMTYTNRLPDAERSRVQAYTTSTDQTLQWADPFSLKALGAYPPPEFFNPFPGIPYATNPGFFPEMNACNEEAKHLPPNLLMPSKDEKAIITNSEFFRAVVQIVKESGGRPVLLESPAIHSLERTIKKTSYAQVVESENIEIANPAQTKSLHFDGARK